MNKENLSHRALFEYDTIENTAKTYKKKVQHIAAIMQQKSIRSLGLPYDDLFNFEGTASNIVKPSDHIEIPFETWKNYQFDEQEIFLYGTVKLPALGSTQDIQSGYKDIHIHKEEFRKKSGLIKTHKRAHARTEIVKSLYLEIGQGKHISPTEFVEELFNLAGDDDRIHSMEGLSADDHITFCTDAGAFKRTKVKSLKTKISTFNKDIAKP